MLNNSNNPITEAALIIISVALIAAATVLFILGKIDYTGCIAILGMTLALWGANSLYKAPSPSQQVQIGAQQQSLQDVISQLMNVLPALFQVHSHPVPTTPTPVTVVPPAPIAPPPAPVVPQPIQQQPFPAQALAGPSAGVNLPAALAYPPQALPHVYTPPPAVARSFGDTSSMPAV